MLYSVTFLCTLTVIETVESTYKIACYKAYPVKCYIVGMLFSTAARTCFTDYTCISAAWIAVNRVVYSTIADA